MIQKYFILLVPVFFMAACDSSQESGSSSAVSEKNISEVEKSPVTEVVIKPVESPEIIVSPKPEKVAEKPKESLPEPPPESTEKMSLSGEQVYNKSCQNCHATGAAGAPKLGDATIWNKRIEKGIEALYISAINGVPSTAMMPKGTCGTCSDDELKAAVDFMVSKVNSN